MERLLQYLDELDDVVYAMALIVERVRTLCGFVFSILLMLTAQAAAVYAAVTNPPLAVAVASLLAVALLYRGVVSGIRGVQAAT